MEAKDDSLGFDFKGVFTKVEPLRYIHYRLEESYSSRQINKEIKMNQLSKLSFMAILLLNMLTLSSVTEASDCNKESPYLNIGEDKYFDLDIYKKLTNTEKRELSSFYDRISGDWVGNSIHMECKGPINSPERITKEAKVTAGIQNNTNNELTISYDANYLKSRTSRLHKIKTLGNKNFFALKFSSDNSLNFSEKYRKRNALGGTILVENIFDIKVDNDLLEIKLTVYNNGFFAWSEVLTLKQK